jgi:low affinity Fe/Cu permease
LEFNFQLLPGRTEAGKLKLELEFHLMALDRNMTTQRVRSRPGFVKRSGAFQKFARASARATGHPIAFGLAIGTIIFWAATGPLFGFSDTWQLVINTATTVITFLMVFLIQNTQNRDSEAMQLKLDELIRATEEAHNAVLDIEELSERELDLIKSRYEQLARQAREDLRAGKSDLGRPEMNQEADGSADGPVRKRKENK